MINDNQHSVLQTHDLTIGYGPKVVAEGISVKLHSGELVCLMGPNGSGKSTLIKTMAGMLPPLNGAIDLFGTSVSKLTSKAIAQNMSTVLTDRITIGNLDVFTLVSFGRSPYTGWLGTLRKEDEKAVQWAIEATGLKPLAFRDISTLSDGERQKVMIARALAQDTDLILLDEPTAHLDLPNRVEIIRLLRKLARETDKGILLSTHELDLALKAGDRAWLIDTTGELFCGVPEDMVLNGTFEKVFARDSFDFDRATGSFKLHKTNGKKIAVRGDPVGRFWTRRALEREGFEVTKPRPASPVISVQLGEEGFRWMFENHGERHCSNSIESLINIVRENAK